MSKFVTSQSDNSENFVTENTSYTWVIKRFSKLDGTTYSPVFPESEQANRWRFELYQRKDYYNPDNYELYLTLVNERNVLKISQLSFRILNSKDEILISKNIKANDFQRVQVECAKKTDLEKYVFRDTLKIQITIQLQLFKLYAFHEIKSKIFKNYTKFMTDQEAMLNSGDFSDFIIKVENVDIAVHKYILAARSAVFAAMLRNNTKEKNDGYVEIKDIDKNTVSAFLRFMYTTEISISNAEEAQKLFFAADKYELMDLKDYCENYLLNNIKASNALDVLILSKSHNIPKLEKKATEYIMENISSFNGTKRFHQLLSEEPDFLTKIINKLLEESNPKYLI